MAFVYILECADRSYYVGSTAKELEARAWEHNHGLGSSYTRKRGRTPARVVWFEVHERVEDGLAREKQIQGWGRAKRLALIEGRLEDLPGLSRSRQAR